MIKGQYKLINEKKVRKSKHRAKKYRVSRLCELSQWQEKNFQDLCEFIINEPQTKKNNIDLENLLNFFKITSLKYKKLKEDKKFMNLATIAVMHDKDVFLRILIDFNNSYLFTNKLDEKGEPIVASPLIIAIGKRSLPMIEIILGYEHAIKRNMVQFVIEYKMAKDWYKSSPLAGAYNDEKEILAMLKNVVER